MQYRAEIDGLRALAVVPVILFHAGSATFSGGFVGVDVFFVISGYLITSIILQDLERNCFSIVDFYERRARRILPVLYCVAIATTFASSAILYPEQLSAFAKSLVATPLFAANIYFWSERGYFGESSELKPLIHLWSLAVEEQFYVIFPLFLLLFYKYKKALGAILGFAILMSLTSSFYVTQIHFDTAFYSPFTRAWELLVGSVAAILLRQRFSISKPLVAELTAIIGLILIFFAYMNFDSATPFPGLYATIPVIGTFLLIIASSSTFYVMKILSLKPLVVLGLLSYSLYLWHQPIFALARHQEVFEGNFAILGLLTLVLSYVTYRYVESPFRNKLFLSRFYVFGLSIVFAVVLICAGLYILSRDGFASRYPSEDRALLVQLAQYQGYNEKIFDSFEGKTFREDARKRVVVVGDSYAKDLLNIVVESGRFANVQFSTRQVNSECGNLYLDDYSFIEQHIPRNRLERCRVLGWYGGRASKEIFSEADEIWIAASWNEWVIGYLPQSIQNLYDDYAVPVRVFGVKNFGEIAPYELLTIPARERVEYTQSVSEDAVDVSIKLGEALKGYEFYYPLLGPLCGGDFRECKVFTEEGLLVSADGGHLTQEGAIEASKRINPVLEAVAVSLHQ